MSRFTFFTLVFLFGWTGNVGAQDIPFPLDNAVWKEDHLTIAGPFSRFFELCGDTLINDTTYSKVWEIQVDNSLNITGRAYQGGLRTDGDRVFYFPSFGSTAHLLYDFGLQPGDVVSLVSFYGSGTVERTVDSVAVKLFDTVMRKVIYFHPTDPSEYPVEWWVEGVGSTYGLLGRAMQPGGDIGSSLLCFEHNDEYVTFSLIECFLPQPGDCAYSSVGQEEDPSPVRLTASPNPGGDSEVRFTINQHKVLKDSRISVYAANGKLLRSIENVQLETPWTGQRLPAGFYIAVLESKTTGRSLAHCTFMLRG